MAVQYTTVRPSRSGFLNGTIFEVVYSEATRDWFLLVASQFGGLQIPASGESFSFTPRVRFTAVSESSLNSFGLMHWDYSVPTRSRITVFLATDGSPSESTEAQLGALADAWSNRFLGESAPVKTLFASGSSSVNSRNQYRRPDLWSDVYAIPAEIAAYQDVYALNAEIPIWQDVYTLGAESTVWKDVYAIPAALEGFTDVYRIPASISAGVEHPTIGRYSFAYDDGGDITRGVRPSDNNPVEGFLLASKRAVPGQVMPTETLQAILQSDAGCHILETLQRMPGGYTPSPHLTTFGLTVNQPSGFVEIDTQWRGGWAKAQIGRLYYMLIGRSLRGQRFLTLGTNVDFGSEHMEIIYEYADAAPQWWTDGLPARTTGIVDEQRLVWTWDHPDEPHRGGGGVFDTDDRPYPYYDCLGIYQGIPEWKDVYAIPASLDVWQDVYTLAAEFSEWQDVYSIPASIVGFTDVYTIPAMLERGLTGWIDIYTLDANIEPPTLWKDVYEIPAELQRGPHYQDVYRIPAFLGADVVDVERPGRDPLSIGSNLLRGSVRIGRTEASHLSRVLPTQMQLVVDNSSGNFGPEQIDPQAKITWRWQGITVGVGWARTPITQTDHRTGLSIVIINCEGAFNRLARSFHELSLFIGRGTVRTGDVMNETLDLADWPAADRRIDRGQVRLNPAHYPGLLTGRQIHQAMPPLRAMEDAEIGLLHEGRGDTPSFQDRFFRELDPRDPVFRFGTLEGAIPTERIVQATESFDNVYTVVRVGMERAVVQADRKVYTWRKDEPEADRRMVVPAGRTRSIEFSLIDEPQNRENDAVATVIQWTNHVYNLTPPTARVEIENTRRSSVVFKVTAPAGQDAVLSGVELHGRGIALYGDLAIPERRDDAAVERYGRRILNLPKSFTGDGTNHGGDFVQAGEAQADLLLYRHSQPPIQGKLPIDANAYPQVMRDVAISDPVSVDSSTGLPGAVYHVEGWEFHLDEENGTAEMVLDVSRRPRRTLQVNRNLNYVASSDAWQDVAPAAAAHAEHPTVFGLDVHLPPTTPSESHDEVLRLVDSDDRPLRIWELQDVPADVVGHPLAAVAPAGRESYRFQARRQSGFSLRATRIRVAQMGVASRPQ